MTVHSKQQNPNKPMKPQTTKIAVILLFLVLTIAIETAYIIMLSGGKNAIMVGGLTSLVFTLLLLMHLVDLVVEAARLQHFNEAFQLPDMKLGKYIISGEGEDRKGNHYIIIHPIETSVSDRNTIQFKRTSRYGIPLYCNKSIAPTRPLGGSYEAVEIIKDPHTGQKHISSKYIEPLPQGLEIQ